MQLTGAKTENEALAVFKACTAMGDDLLPIVQMGLFLAFLRKADPALGLKALKGSRAVDAEHPGAKVGVYGDRGKYAAKSDVFKLSAGYTKMLTTLQAQLKPLEGK